MRKILVTGGLGKLGRWVVKELESHYEVLVVDRRDPVSSDKLNSSFRLMNLYESDQIIAALKNVIHMNMPNRMNVLRWSDEQKELEIYHSYSTVSSCSQKRPE